MYDFHQATVDSDSIKLYTELLMQVFPESNIFVEEYLKWEYSDNPIGEIVGFNAFENGNLVAHYVCQPVVANLFGKQARGLLSLNTATHEAHRGKGLFTKLADLTYKYAAENGFEFVYGVANANSTPGFIKKLDFQLVAPLDVKFGIGKIAKNITRDQYCFKRNWTRELLEWRVKNPIRAYEITSDRIYADSKKYGIKAILGEFEKDIIDNIKGSKLKSLNPVKLFVGLDNNINWKKSMYFNVPESLKSSPLNLIFKDLTEKNRKLNTKCIKFQVFDFDGY